MTAGALYRATVGHRRFAPVGHSLRAQATYLLLDLDSLDETARRLRLFGRTLGLFLLRERDLGPPGEGRLADRVRGLLDRHGLAEASRRIEVLCLPRVLGYVFNPLTVYYGRRADGSLGAVVYEVSNTFGERLHYVLPVTEPDADTVQQACAKTLYVSPFNPADGAYDFRLTPPAETLRLTVTLSRGGHRVMAAWVAGERRPLTDREILRAFLSQPFLTYGVIARIHLEALKLWRNGLKLAPRPRGAKHSGSLPASVEGRG